MAGSTRLFDKYLLRKALRCPTKLYYTNHADRYPKKSFFSLFSKHNTRMRRKLEMIAHDSFPSGQYAGTAEAYSAIEHTKELLKEDNISVYHAIIVANQCRAKIPILSKQDGDIIIGMVRLKSVDSDRFGRGDFNRYARSRWKRYLMEFAFLKWIVESSLSQPSSSIRCQLLLPDKSYKSEVDNAYQKLLVDLENNVMKNEMSRKERQKIQPLLVNTDVTNLVDEILQGTDLPVRTDTDLDRLNFNELVNYLRDLWTSGEKFDPPIGSRCGGCEFRIPEEDLSEGKLSGFAECWSDHIPAFTYQANEDHILSLKGHGKQEFIQRGIYDMSNIADEHLNVDEEKIGEMSGTISQADRQYLRIKKAKNQQQTSELIKPGLFKELKRWEYPLHFIDFEAATLPVPIRRGGRSYERLFFQYSCHTLKKNGTLLHHQWLETTPGRFPNFNMVKAFQQIPDITEGTLIQYSQFEKSAFKKIRRQLAQQDSEAKENADLLQWIHRIISRPDSKKTYGPYFADLQRLIKQYYHNMYMDGAMGIKEVLAAVLKISDHLKEIYREPYNSSNFSNVKWWQTRRSDGLPENPYRLLDYEVGDGADAFAIYGHLQERDMPESKREKYRDALYKYCELDTLAMVMIFQHWQAKMEMIKTD